MGKRKGKSDRHTFPCLWSRKVRVLFYRLAHLQVLILVVGHDLSYKPNDSVIDVTRNLRNLRPSVELREEWLYNNQVCRPSPSLTFA